MVTVFSVLVTDGPVNTIKVFGTESQANTWIVETYGGEANVDVGNDVEALIDRLEIQRDISFWIVSHEITL